MFVSVKRFLPAFFAIVALFMLMGASDCEGGNDTGRELRNDSVDHRYDILKKAQRVHPDPSLVNFVQREVLIKMSEREDLLNHPWYVYITGENGNVVGYYVASTVPVNACNFLSSTEDVRDDESGNNVLQAPSLDGMYYGSSQCDVWVFFDLATDNEIRIRGMNFHVSDGPLILDSEPIKYEVQETP